MTIDRILQHLYLVGLASIFTILIGLLLGVIVYLYQPIRPFMLGLVDVLQTIPVLALLGVIMLIFGASSTTGIRIAVVTSIGTAVFGSVVGGGGLGSVINRAILVQDMDSLLKATLVLMAMAVVFDLILGRIEQKLNEKKELITIELTSEEII